jgi:hypothetical protein
MKFIVSVDKAGLMRKELHRSLNLWPNPGMRNYKVFGTLPQAVLVQERCED